MKRFFRSQFSTSLDLEKSDAPFHSLYSVVTDGSMAAYLLMFIVGMIIIVVTFMISAIRLYFASHGQQREQAKAALIRNMLVTVGIVVAVDVAIIIVNAFS